MILESIATTTDQEGRINIAPLGPVVDGPELTQFRLRPYQGSTTCDNLLSTRCVTLHVTDDVRLFARSAIGSVQEASDVVPITSSSGQGFWKLKRCHRWFALEVTHISGGQPCYEMNTRVVASGVEQPFFGFNRAKHAVIEAAILATRLHLISEDQVRHDMNDLKVLVEKTGSPQEHEAFGWLEAHVRAKLGA